MHKTQLLKYFCLSETFSWMSLLDRQEKQVTDGNRNFSSQALTRPVPNCFRLFVSIFFAKGKDIV